MKLFVLVKQEDGGWRGKRAIVVFDDSLAALPTDLINSCH